MPKGSRLTTFLFLLFASTAFPTFSQAELETCKGAAGQGLARAFGIAIAYPDQLPEFVTRNPALFHVNGKSIVCGRSFIPKLAAAGQKRMSRGEVREKAFDVATRAGIPGLAEGLARDMENSRTDFTALGRSIKELLDTIPPLLDGDVTPYASTAVYRQSALAWSAIMETDLLSPPEIDAYRKVFMEMMEWYLHNLVRAAQ